MTRMLMFFHYTLLLLLSRIPPYILIRTSNAWISYPCCTPRRTFRSTDGDNFAWLITKYKAIPTISHHTFEYPTRPRIHQHNQQKRDTVNGDNINGEKQQQGGLLLWNPFYTEESTSSTSVNGVRASSKINDDDGGFWRGMFRRNDTSSSINGVRTTAKTKNPSTPKEQESVSLWRGIFRRNDTGDTPPQVNSNNKPNGVAIVDSSTERGFWWLRPQQDEDNTKKDLKKKTSNNQLIKRDTKKNDNIQSTKQKERPESKPKKVKPASSKMVNPKKVTGVQSKTNASTVDLSPFEKVQAFFNRSYSLQDNNNKSSKPQIETNESWINPLVMAQKYIWNLLPDGNKSNSNKNQEQWIVAFPKTRISPGEIVPITVAGIDLLVIASKDTGKLYCIANACPHLGTPLETGQLVRLPMEDNNNNNNNAGGGSSISISSSMTPSTTTSNAWWGNMDTSSSSSLPISFNTNDVRLTEMDVSNILSQDGCEDCIVCPLHKTAFALQSGEVRGEWCPHPPVLGPILGTLKPMTSAPIFPTRTVGKNIEVRINSPLTDQPPPLSSSSSSQQQQQQQQQSSSSTK